jgi:glycyl-tRNA synthetase beta chain
MSLPPEVLSTAMKVHQKYFSTTDSKNNLAPNFIFVANSLSDTKRDATVVEGNERVLKARLSDANFFWKSDLSKTFEYWNDKLKNVVFYEGLGSVYDKTLRMSEISKYIAKVFSVNSSFASQAALLSKADLASEMVGEFPELQGVMGGYYSKLMGYNNEVSNALTEHYKPKGVLDSIPKTNIGGMLSIIDKIDTLTCFFVIGKKPTGSKDPLALRRSALGIVQIMIGFNINITMYELFSNSLNLHNNVSKALEIELMDFILDRLRIILKAEGIKLDVIESILTLSIIHNLPFQIIYKRITALNETRNTENFKLFLVNFKRLNNILKSSDVLSFSNFDININLFQSPIETKLFQAINDLKKVIKISEFELNNQEVFLKAIKELQIPINLFFESIIVNVENKEIKDNRLKLMFRLKELIIKYSNFDIIED